MTNPNPSKKITVEKLLQLKRSEQPSSEFWNRFEAELNVKRLQALVERPSFTEKLRWLLRKSFLWATPVGGLAAVSLFFYQGQFLQNKSGTEEVEFVAADRIAEVSTPVLAVQDTPIFASQSPVARAVGSPEISRFIVDSFSADGERQAAHYRRVLYTPSFSVDRSDDSRYVADPISHPRQSLIQQAGFSSGRNF
jgi:hypothetical protein